MLYIRHNTTLFLRKFLNKSGFIETDAPTLVPSLIPEAYLEPFSTLISSPGKNKKKAYLSPSPEAYMKRILCKNPTLSLYYLGKAFRNNEPIGPLHNHEFTILEWYSNSADYKQLMKQVADMIIFVIQSLAHKKLIKLPFNINKKWEYITVSHAFSRFVPKKYFVNPETCDTQTFERLYVLYIEPKLGIRGVPAFITDFPSHQSPLAQTHKNKKLAQRFELYYKGIELVNGWTELTDWKIQKQKLKKEAVGRIQQKKTPIKFDHGFITALKSGLPKCAGAAMGIDRLIMALTNQKKIANVIPYPISRLFYSSSD